MHSISLRLAGSVARQRTPVAVLSSRASIPSLSSSKWGISLVIRSVHLARSLLYPVEEGLGEFLPPHALKIVGVEYQQGLLQRLNEEVKGTQEQNQNLVDTVINTSPHKEKTLAFNYASLALNNGFFLDNLKPPPPPPEMNHQSKISSELAQAIRSQHGSVAQLKSAFSSAANGLFTSGWVWFVTDNAGNTGILPTFGPGTLLIRSRSYMASAKGLILGDDMGQWNRGHPLPEEEAVAEGVEGVARTSATGAPTPPGVKPSSPRSGVSTGSASSPNTPPQTRSLHASSALRSDSEIEYDRMPASIWGADPATAPPDSPESKTDIRSWQFSRITPQTKVDMLNIGEVLYPLFCVSVYEHNWISAGYGIWGREEWLKKFWSVLDWGKVSESYVKASKAAQPHKL